MDPDAGSTPGHPAYRSHPGRPGSTRRTGRRLADGAEERRPVHEADPPDRRTAAGAGLVLAAVDLQGPVEVAALAVDVDVEGVEGGAALSEGGGHHGPGRREHPLDVGDPQPDAGPVAVQAGVPERLVGVDVADAG